MKRKNELIELLLEMRLMLSDTEQFYLVCQRMRLLDIESNVVKDFRDTLIKVNKILEIFGEGAAIK